MNKNRIGGMILSVIALILQVSMLFVGPSKDLILKYSSITAAILAALFSFIYFFKGGTKQDAKWRNLFIIMLSISLLFSFIKSIQSDKGMINNICLLLTVIITGYLAFVKDFGKGKSIALALIVVILQIITVIPMLVSGGKITPVKILGIASSTILVLLLLSTTYTKYFDKEQRGSE